MQNKQHLYNLLLHLADNDLILGQRLSEWCGHGPALEQDIALSNIALDLIGQAEMWFQYAQSLGVNDKDQDQLAFTRNEWEYKNVLLVEYPNTDFGYTIVRQFFFDVFHKLVLTKLKESADTQIAAIAEKSLKEVNYHVKFSSEWLIRLGDGTEVSHQKVQTAVNELCDFANELFIPTDSESILAKADIGYDLESMRSTWVSEVRNVLKIATLDAPEDKGHQKGGKNGVHTEYFGHLLSEMQFLQRAYPNLNW